MSTKPAPQPKPRKIGNHPEPEFAYSVWVDGRRTKARTSRSGAYEFALEQERDMSMDEVNAQGYRRRLADWPMGEGGFDFALNRPTWNRSSTTTILIICHGGNKPAQAFNEDEERTWRGPISLYRTPLEGILAGANGDLWEAGPFGTAEPAGGIGKRTE